MDVSQLHAAADPQNPPDEGSGPTSKLFLDENGNPSDRCGPDLTKAEPIGDVIRGLGRMRNVYAIEFWRACRASGIDVSVTRSTDGEDRLGFSLPADSQEDLRLPRYEALSKQLHRSERRRQDVVELANGLGRFTDNQPFTSIEEAANAFLAAGGRIWIEPDGHCEEVLSFKADTFILEESRGFPLRRLYHRYRATVRQRGGRDAVAAFVREHDSVRERSGWLILDGREIANG